MPATYVIHADEKVVPPVISVPAFLAIQLTVVSGDGKEHRAQLRAPHAPGFVVPAGGSGHQRIGGLRAGQYALLIDGKPRASLMTGGEPGP